MKKICYLFLFFLAVNAFAQEIENPLFVQGIDATVTLSANGIVSGDLKNGFVILKVLTFQNNESQSINSISETITINNKTFTADHENDALGNRYAIFKIGEAGDFSYNITANIQTSAKIAALQEYDLGQKISAFPEFLEATKNVESDDARVRTIALNKFTSSSWLETARAISEWANNYIEYDWAFYPETFSTLEVLDTKRGVCDEFATLSTGMLRAKGIPTRFAVGVVYSGEKWGYHAWNEAFNPNSGWVPIDTTYAETGTVDGTHIVMGYFSDPEKAVDFFVAPVTAKVTVNPKEVRVQTNSMIPFKNVVSVKAEDIEITTGKWFTLGVEAENLRQGYIIVPLQLVVPKEITASENTKTVLFAPNEKKTIEWQIRVDTTLPENQFLVGEYTIVSLQETLSREIKVTTGTPTGGKEEIRITDIVPEISGNTLEIEVLLENTGEKQGTARASISGTGISAEKIVPGLGKASILLSLENYENRAYEVVIQASNLQASTIIMPQESIKKPVLEEEKEEQQKTTKQENTLKTAFSDESIFLLLAGAGAIAILLILKELLAK